MTRVCFALSSQAFNFYGQIITMISRRNEFTREPFQRVHELDHAVLDTFVLFLAKFFDDGTKIESRECELQNKSRTIICKLGMFNAESVGKEVQKCGRLFNE